MAHHIEHSDFHDQLVRGLAHRMNNILGLFHGYLGLLLEDDQLRPQTVAGINRIQEGATAAVDLIGRTQSLARPSSLIWREIDPSKYVASIHPALTSCLRKGVDLVVQMEENLPGLWADGGRLRTAIMELVKNAAEAAPDGSRVSFSVFVEQASVLAADNRAEQPVRWVVMAVSNSGPEISGALEKKIYVPFFTTRQARDAAGLGLTVASGLVQQMNGVLRHTSTPDHTCFRIMLPTCAQQSVPR